MPARLTALDDHASILLDKPVLLIGRHPECDIQLGSRKISRRHCCIAQIDGGLAVRDLGSTNGIRINGVPLLEGRLNNGDELTIGNLRYRIEWEEADGGPSVAAPAAPRRKPAKAAIDPLVPDPMVSCDIPIPIAEPEAPGRRDSSRPRGGGRPRRSEDGPPAGPEPEPSEAL